MKRSLSFLFICILFSTIVIFAEPGSCEKYAELVCDICGHDAPICEEARQKSAEHPEDAACERGLELLPSVYKEASDENKEKIRKALCRKEVP